MPLVTPDVMPIPDGSPERNAMPQQMANLVPKAVFLRENLPVLRCLRRREQICCDAAKET
jgi:hypothetical protein